MRLSDACLVLAVGPFLLLVAALIVSEWRGWKKEPKP